MLDIFFPEDVRRLVWSHTRTALLVGGNDYQEQSRGVLLLATSLLSSLGVSETAMQAKLKELVDIHGLSQALVPYGTEGDCVDGSVDRD
jgi:hypothetical protein